MGQGARSPTTGASEPGRDPHRLNYRMTDHHTHSRPGRSGLPRVRPTLAPASVLSLQSPLAGRRRTLNSACKWVRLFQQKAHCCTKGPTSSWFFVRWVSQMPCAHVPGRYAEPSNFKIGIVHPWSWAIGSSTSAAQRSFDYGRLPSESPAFRVEHEIGASGKRPTIPEGNGAVARALFGGLRSHGQRISAKE